MATVTVEEKGLRVRRFCGDCWAIIDLILKETSRMVKSGVPVEVAADWASRAVREIAE